MQGAIPLVEMTHLSIIVLYYLMIGMIHLILYHIVSYCIVLSDVF